MIGELLLKGLIALSAFVLTPTIHAASNYPTQPIRIIVPYGAGSTGDIVIRLLVPKLEANLGQKIIIESRPGAGGNVGASYVANAPADGYVLLFGATNNFAVNQFVYKSMTFDPITSFTPISKVVDFPYVMYVSNSVRAKTVAEFIAEEKENAGKFFYASSGMGTPPHLGGLLFNKLTGAQLVHVPYAGNTQSVQAVLANEVQVYFASVSAGKGHIGDGEHQMRVISTASPARVNGYPEVPSAVEAGIPDLNVSNWWGLAAPAGTPAAIAARLSQAIASTLHDQSLVERFNQLGMVPVGSTPEEFRDSIAADAARWGELIRSSGIKFD